MRKIRLIVTITITALLFSVLVFLASITEGAVHSLKSFGQEGYGSQFFVQANPLTYQPGPGSDQDLKDALAPVQRDLITRKKAAAKTLEVTYDETVDQNLPIQIVKSSPTVTDTYPNYGSPLVQDIFSKRNDAIPGTSYVAFGQAARSAGAVKIYRGTQSGMNYMAGPAGNASQVSVLVDGKEDLSALTGTPMNGPLNTTGVASITSLGWRSVDGDLLRPFVLPGQTMVTGKDQSLPIIAPYSAAEEILSLKALPQTATSEQKLARLVAVRRSIAGKTAQLCYRNASSADLLSQAVQQQKEMENNKKNKDYIMPSLVYQLPTVSCGEVTVKSDKRTEDEKKQAAHNKAFDTEFGLSQDPIQGTIMIRIIGLSPDINYGANISPTAVLTSLLTSSTGGGWVSPAKAIENDHLANTVQGGTAATAPRSKVVYYAQFATFSKMDNFIKDQTCKDLTQVHGPDGASHAIDISGQGTSTANCIQQGRVLTVSPYGNSAGAVEQFRAGIWKFARFAVLAIVIMASLIMMGNVGKIIADSRRETAVFRSLGAKRIDIAEIYLTYTVLISLLVAVCSVVTGSIAANLLSGRYSGGLSVSAVLAYNAQDAHKTFSLFGFNPLYILAIAGLTVVAGLLSAILPLLSNTRRNPIRDMRDDS